MDEALQMGINIDNLEPAVRAEMLVVLGLRRLEAMVAQLAKRDMSCALRGSKGGAHVGMLIGPESATRSDAIKEIRDFTLGATNLVLIDPYAAGASTDSAESYVDQLVRAARIDGKELKSLHIIFDSEKSNTKAVWKELKRRTKSADVRFTRHDAGEIHDRIWIADRKKGLVVGTSFGGIGQRYAFLLPLPEHDLKSMLAAIDANEYMLDLKERQASKHKQKSAC